MELRTYIWYCLGDRPQLQLCSELFYSGTCNQSAKPV